MADITKCVGGEAELCKTCWRRLSPDNMNSQSWMPIPLYDNGKCEEYWSKDDPAKNA